MNLDGERWAAVLLALLFSGAQFVQERFDLRWPGWELRDGAVVRGEMRDFEWETKSLLVSVAGEEGAIRIAAEDLGFWSKLRMLGSAPFSDRLAYHLPELEANPGYRAGLERLQRLGLTLVGAYVFLFCAVNWLLAGWILRSGSILRWLEGGAAFGLLAALCGALVVALVRQFGDHQILEYVSLAVVLHTLLYWAVIWVVYQAGPWRPLIWYGLCWLLALTLPVTLGGTALVAQVHGFAGALDGAAWDRYLTEVWLRPMGLL